MTKRVLVIGGYGNFGQFICRQLAREADIQVLIAGRDLAKAQTLAADIAAVQPALPVQLDIHRNLAEVLRQYRPQVVIHTSGPFQAQGYEVAQACIEQGCHYIDLADGRDFVSSIGQLDSAARERQVLICSGASSVPALSSAIIDRYIDEFQRLDSVEYAISTAQKTRRGLATMAAVLSYAGKPFSTLIEGTMQPVYGWQDLRSRPFFGLDKRLLGNCDVPDLALFPQRYPTLTDVRFQAGLELKPVHLTLFSLAWCVRLGLLRSLQPLAPTLLKIAGLFDPFGSAASGFYMLLRGSDAQGAAKQIRFDLRAENGDGLLIPCIPAILLALKLARGETKSIGAQPCMGLITLEEYLAALGDFAIQWRVG